MSEVVSGSIMPNKLPFGGITAAIGVVTAAASFMKIVPKNHEGIRVRFDNPAYNADSPLFPWQLEGNPIGWVGPGPHAAVPGLHSIRTISTQDEVSALHFVHDPKKGKQRHVTAQLTWGVGRRDDDNGDRIPYEDMYGAYHTELLGRAIFKFTSEKAREDKIVGKAAAGLRRMFNASPDLLWAESDENDIMPLLVERCRDELMLDYGLEIRGFEMLSTDRTYPEVLGSKMRKKRRVAAVALSGDGKTPPELHVVPHPEQEPGA